MADTGYLLAREMTSRVGQSLIYLILLFSIVLAVVAIVPRLRLYAKYVVLALFLNLLTGWLLLVNFHYQIAVNVALVDPSGRMPTGYFYIPVWVEDEKFFFWTLILSILVLTSRYRETMWRVSINVVLALFGVLTFFTSNPFAQPLKDFHESYMNYAVVMASSAPQLAKAQTFYGLYGKMVGFYNSQYMWMHPPMVFISYALFVVAFVGCVFMFTNRGQEYEKLAYAYAKPGYILLTVGMLLGYPWAISAWKGSPWWWDPKINVSLMMWVMYSAYLHTRIYIHRPGMRVSTAVFGYLAFFGVIFTYVSTYLIPGIHAVAGG